MAGTGALARLRHQPRALWWLVRRPNRDSNHNAEPGSGGVATASREEGELDLGALRRLKPISSNSGYDRGLPVDRYYIEEFLGAHAADIRGRVLEIGGSDYTETFGGARVTAIDVLNVDDGDPQTTIVADLSHAEHIPSDTFDCIIATQTLQYVDDVESAARALHRILRPGGVLLLTAPGTVSRISPDPWRGRWN